MTTTHDEIRNLLYRYCELMDGGQFEELADLFAEAALQDGDGNEIARGRAGVLRLYRDGTQLYDGSPRTRHVTANSIIEVDEDAGEAMARSVYVVFQGTPDLALQPIITGRYRDRFQLAAEGWRFVQRQFFVDVVGNLSAHLTYELR